MSNVEGKVSSELTLEEVFTAIQKMVDTKEITPDRVMALVRREIRNTIELSKNKEHLPENVPDLEKLICSLSGEAVNSRKELISSVHRLIDLRYALSSRLKRMCEIFDQKHLWSLPRGKKKIFRGKITDILMELAQKNEEIPARKYPMLEELNPAALEEKLEKSGEKDLRATRLSRSQFLDRDRRYGFADHCNIFSAQLDELKLNVFEIKNNIKHNTNRIEYYNGLVKELEGLIEGFMDSIEKIIEEKYEDGKFIDMKEAVERQTKAMSFELEQRFPEKKR